MTSSKGICFFISPIGTEKSDIRKRSDRVMNFIIKPVADALDYETVRGDLMANSGLITPEILQMVMDSPLVIADLSDQNPNVFYELAVRHAVKKPVILMIQKGQSIPFDIADMRVIHYGLELEEVEEAKALLDKSIKNVEANADDIHNPISMTIDLQKLRKSSLPQDKQNATILSLLMAIKVDIEHIRENTPDMIKEIDGSLYERRIDYDPKEWEVDDIPF